MEVGKWNAEISSKKLKALSFVVQDLSTGTPAEKPLIELNLAPQENSDMIAGIAKLATSGTEMASAKVQLQIDGMEKFGLIIDNVVANDPAITDMLWLKKFEIFMNQKNSDTSRTIDIPKETIPMYEVNQHLESIEGSYKTYSNMGTDSDESTGAMSETNASDTEITESSNQ